MSPRPPVRRDREVSPTQLVLQSLHTYSPFRISVPIRTLSAANTQGHDYGTGAVESNVLSVNYH